MMVRSRSWNIVDPQAIRYRELEDEVVVYNDSTGSTHHLAPLGRAILMALLQHPQGMGTSDLLRLVDDNVEHSQSVSDDFERTLDALVDLELVDCVIV